MAAVQGWVLRRWSHTGQLHRETASSAGALLAATARCSHGQHLNSLTVDLDDNRPAEFINGPNRYSDTEEDDEASTRQRT